MKIIRIKQSEFKTYFKKNKYGNKKVELDGKKFDSKSEGDYYSELMFQKKQGIIKDVECQVKEELWAYGVHIGNYYVDFLVTHNDDSFEYVEHKGMETDLWKWKMKMLKAKYKNHPTMKISINYYRQKYVPVKSKYRKSVNTGK